MIFARLLTFLFSRWTRKLTLVCLLRTRRFVELNVRIRCVFGCCFDWLLRIFGVEWTFQCLDLSTLVQSLVEWFTFHVFELLFDVWLQVLPWLTVTAIDLGFSWFWSIWQELLWCLVICFGWSLGNPSNRIARSLKGLISFWRVLLFLMSPTSWGGLDAK